MTKTRNFSDTKGDILTTRQSPFPMVRWFHPLGDLLLWRSCRHTRRRNGFIEDGVSETDESLFDIMFHPRTEPHDYSVTVARNSRNNWLVKGFRVKATNPIRTTGHITGPKRFALRVKVSPMNRSTVSSISGMPLVENDVIYNFLFFLS